MAQDLLAALGARIEAQLKARDTRPRSIEEAVKAQVSANPPASFSLLAEDMRPYAFLPAVSETNTSVPVTRIEAANQLSVTISPAETFPSAADISAAIAPFAALLSDTARVLTESAPATSSEARTINTITAAPIASDAQAAAIPSASSVVASVQATSASADQVINRVPNYTPMVPAEFGVGATVRRKGVLSDAPMTVTQSYNGLIRAVNTDSTGTHIFEFQYNQFDLLAPAPG